MSEQFSLCSRQSVGEDCLTSVSCVYNWC